MKQTVIIRATVGEDEVDMNLVCDFICDFGEAETTDHPGSGGSCFLEEARLPCGKSTMSTLTAGDKSWLQDKAWDIIQGADISE